MWPLLRSRLRRGLRELGVHAFDLGVLLPIVAGAFLLLAGRSLELFRAPVAALLADPDTGPRTLAALACGLLAAYWPGTWRALYGRAARVELLDVLPLPESRRYLAILLGLPWRTLPFAALWVGGGWILAGLAQVPADRPEFSGWAALAVAWPAALLVAAFGLPLAQAAAHWGLARAAWLAIAFAGLLLAAISPWGAVLAWPCHLAGALLRRAWLRAAGLEAPVFAWLDVVATLVVLLALAAIFFRHRRADLADAGAQSERGLPLPVFGRRAAAKPERRLQRALVRRDLLLVARFFSPAVPITLGAALLIGLALARTLIGLPVESPADRESFMRLALTLAVAAMVPWLSLTPFLLARHLRQGWLESTLGAPHEVLVRASVRTPVLLALPPTLAALLVVGGLAWWRLENPMAVTGLILQIGSTSLMVAAIFGLAAWEVPGQPLVAAVYGWIVGGVFVALVAIAPQALPFIWLGFAWLFAQMRTRALARASFLERPR